MGKRLLAVMIIALLVPAVFAQEYDPALLVETGQTAAENLSALCELQGYAELYTSDQELLSLIGGWGGDWTKPENRRRAAVASIPREAVAQLMPLVPGLSTQDAGTHLDLFCLNLMDLPASFLNSRAGVTRLAASSIARYESLRVMDEHRSRLSFVLLDYGDAHPMVLVSFCAGEDGACAIHTAFVDVPRSTADLLFMIASGKRDFTGILSRLPELWGLGEDPDEEAALAALKALDLVEFAVF